jgi:hypothetical protein
VSHQHLADVHFLHTYLQQEMLPVIGTQFICAFKEISKTVNENIDLPVWVGGGVEGVI